MLGKREVFNQSSRKLHCIYRYAKKEGNWKRTLLSLGAISSMQSLFCFACVYRVFAVNSAGTDEYTFCSWTLNIVLKNNNWQQGFRASRKSGEQVLSMSWWWLMALVLVAVWFDNCAGNSEEDDSTLYEHT